MKIQHIASAALFASQISAAFQLQPAAPIEIKGTKFYNSSSGTQFYVRGVAYQRSRRNGDNFDVQRDTAYIDSLAHPHKCLRDLDYLVELGVNTVRAYQINPRLSHDVCMAAFADRGIYVLADLSEPQASINREFPAWDTDLSARYRAVIDSMHNYTNVLGFIAGNEVLNTVNNSNTAAFVKASVRDAKAHIRRSGYRKIPVGYASVDESATRVESAHYFTCEDGGDDTRVDFYGLNNFGWCGYATYDTSGYRERTAEFAALPVPVMFTEFGCNRMKPRAFTEVDALFGPPMAGVWSGGVAYEFFQNENDYGLVRETAAGRLVKMDDFNIFKLRLVESVPRGTPAAAQAARPGPACPALSPTWNSSAALPPPPDVGVCQCVQASLSCVLSPNVPVDPYRLLRELCATTDCSVCAADASRGVYGPLSGCGVRQKVSYLLNKVWLESGKDPRACSHNGRAMLVPREETREMAAVRAADGRTCADVLKRSVPELKVASASGGRHGDAERGFRMNNAAPVATHWGYVLLPVFVVSFMYFTT